MKHRRIGIAVVTALALAASACGSETEETGGGSSEAKPASGPVTLQLLAAEYSSATKPYWDGLSKEFTAANPDIKVEVQVVNWDNIDQQVTTLVSSGKQPDILNLNKFSGFADEGLLYTADEVLDEKVVADFIPTFAENAQYKDKQYGLPFIASARAMFYNKALFAAAGITEAPTTWDEFTEAAKKLTSGDQYGYGLPLGPEEAQGEFAIWAFNNGGDWKDGDTWTVNSDKNVEALKFLNGLANTDKVTQPNPGPTNRADVLNQFKAGKIAMAMALPPFVKQFKEAGIDFGIVPPPSNTGETATLAVQDYMMAFKNEGKKDAVSKFLNFFYSQENYTKFLMGEGFLPVTESGATTMASDANLKPFLDLLPSAKFAPTTDPKWDVLSKAVQQQIGQAVAGSEPQMVLDDLQKIAES